MRLPFTWVSFSSIRYRAVSRSCRLCSPIRKVGLLPEKTSGQQRHIGGNGLSPLGYGIDATGSNANGKEAAEQVDNGWNSVQPHFMHFWPHSG